MMISVRERTRDPGSNARSARRRSTVIGQILKEATVLTALAGALGLVAGVGALEGIGRLMKASAEGGPSLFEPPRADFGVALAATAVVIVGGALAGLFPARCTPCGSDRWSRCETSDADPGFSPPGGVMHSPRWSATRDDRTTSRDVGARRGPAPAASGQRRLGRDQARARGARAARPRGWLRRDALVSVPEVEGRAARGQTEKADCITTS